MHPLDPDPYVVCLQAAYYAILHGAPSPVARYFLKEAQAIVQAAAALDPDYWTPIMDELEAATALAAVSSWLKEDPK